MRILWACCAAVAVAAAAMSATTAHADPTSTTDSGGSVYYPNCKAAAADGAYNIQQGQPGYRSALDRDGDGVACDS